MALETQICFRTYLPLLSCTHRGCMQLLHIWEAYHQQYHKRFALFLCTCTCGKSHTTKLQIFFSHWFELCLQVNSSFLFQLSLVLSFFLSHKISCNYRLPLIFFDPMNAKLMIYPKFMFNEETHNFSIFLHKLLFYFSLL